MTEDEPLSEGRASGNQTGPGCPPRENQFKKGQSGNPKGRPARKVADKTSGDLFLEVLSRPGSAARAGKRVKITLEDTVVEVMTREALAGKVSAARAFFEICKEVDAYHRRVGKPEDFSPEAAAEVRRKIMGFVAKVEAKRQTPTGMQEEVIGEQGEEAMSDQRPSERSLNKARRGEDALSIPKNELEAALSRFSKAIGQPINLKTGTGIKRVSRQEAIIIGLRRAATLGKVSALRLLRYIHRYSAEQAVLSRQEADFYAQDAAEVKRKIEDMAARFEADRKSRFSNE